MKIERSTPVTAFACFAALLVLISAYCTDRNGAVDEPGFLNPPYMLAHYGHLTFPTYAYNGFYDLPVITHPPVHTLWIGLLWRLGLTVYYAEATPTVLLLLLGIAIILCSRFPVPVKLGWLFAIGFLAASGDTLTDCFGSRPEGEIQAAWFCGLLLLEAGRLEDWDWRRLCAGALFLTWASGTHYYAGPASAGVAVYMLWAVRSLGWKQARPRLAAMAAGACAFALPYLGLYVIPYFHEIRSTISGVVGQGGVALSVHRHLDLYRIWVGQSYHPALVRQGMATGVPLVVFTTAILAAVRSTRGVALAALPLQLGVFLLVWRKMAYYLIHESVLFAAAVSIGLLVLGHYLLRRFRPGWERGFAPVAALALSVYLVESSPTLKAVSVGLQPRVHEMEVAHAAGRQMLGPHARMGGRWWAWYASGAEDWFDVERDLVLGSLTLDPATYLSNLDALEVCPSGDEPGLIPAWYAGGTARLRGFFFAQVNPTLRCVQLGSARPVPLVGYAAWNGQLYRFQEEDEGGYEVLSAVCERGAPEWNEPWNGAFSVGLDISQGPDAGRRMVTLLAPRPRMAPYGPIGRSCREVSRARGTLAFDNWRWLVGGDRADQPPMRFHRNVEDLPGYRGVGLSQNAIAPRDAAPAPDATPDLNGALPSGPARLERLPQLRVTTIPVLGGFSAYIPVKHAGTASSAGWITLRLRVLRGRVGFGTLPWNPAQPVKTKAIAPSPEPQTVALPTPDLGHTDQIVVYNEGTGASEVDIFEARALVQAVDRGAAAGGRKP